MRPGTPRRTPGTSTSPEHIVYLGVDGHVHELHFGGAWTSNDLTTLSGVPVLPAGNPFGYTWDVDHTQHVNYRGVDGNIYELWYDTRWHYSVPSSEAAAPKAAGDPAGYVWSGDHAQHVNYLGVDGHIHELRSRHPLDPQ